MLEQIYSFLEYWMLFTAFGIYFSTYVFNRFFDNKWTSVVEDVSWISFITSFFLFQCADNQAMINWFMKMMTMTVGRPGSI